MEGGYDCASQLLLSGLKELGYANEDVLFSSLSCGTWESRGERALKLIQDLYALDFKGRKARMKEVGLRKQFGKKLP